MSWTDELYNVYEKICGRSDLDPPLLPLSHSTANAQIELVVDENGNFVSASQIDKKDAITVIPVSNDSGARSSGIFPHPFDDKLFYIAGDFCQYADGKKNDNSEHFEAYISGLKQWAESEHSHKAVEAIYAYLSKKTLMQDLISCKVLELDEETKLLKSGVKIAGIAQEDSFVRFKISYSNLDLEMRTWQDKSLIDCFIAYNSTVMQQRGLCYATGEILPLTYKHPSKIRNAGDKARLISSNDESGFSYRGRFANKEQALSVSYDFSQKMHNGLKWLIGRQGISIENSLMLVVWESSMKELPKIIVSASDMQDDLQFEDEVPIADTFVAYKNLLKRSIFGHENQLNFVDKTSKAMVLGLDSATPGRVSIVIYTELATSDLLKNIEKWHQDTAWFRFNGKKKVNEINSFALKEIIELAFGVEQGDFVKCKPEVTKDYMCRLIDCVTQGKDIPKDIVRALVIRASSPLKYSKEYNWRKVLEAACGMLRKQKLENKEECEMALDEKCTDRSYLYGRLLAVADVAESSTYDVGESRTTNAKRYFEAFTNKPCVTWDTIYKRLQPYLNGMSASTRVYYTKLINEITDMFDKDAFTDNSKLQPEYLHAYSCQIKKLYTKKDNTDNT